MFQNITFNDSADAAYCEKLAQRFANMGIAQKASQNAVAALAEKSAVPDFIPCAATPSMFPSKTAAPAPVTLASKLCSIFQTIPDQADSGKVPRCPELA